MGRKLLMPANTNEFLQWRFSDHARERLDVDKPHHVKYLFNTFWLKSPMAQWFNLSWHIDSVDKMHDRAS